MQKSTPQKAVSEIQHSFGSRRVVRASAHGDDVAVAVEVAVGVAVVVSSGIFLDWVSFG
jgi:hypothetical protein